jgi:hypothetical protein
VEQQEILLSLAEIAAVFIGFAGIAMVIARNESGQLTDLGQFRLSALLQTGLGCIFMALLPFLLYYLGMRGTQLWQVVSLVAATIFLAFAVQSGLKFFRMREKYTDRLILGWAFLFNFVISPLVMVAVACNGLGIFFKGEFGIYLMGVMTVLAVCAGQFLLLIFRTNKNLIANNKEPENGT